MKRSASIVALAVVTAVLGSSVPTSVPTWADSGQLRDPTRCGTGPANCRKLPPVTNDTRREPSSPSSESRRKVGERPSLMHTSPLPSESLQRNPDAPGSTGLDKGSTGLTPLPKKKSLGH